MLRVKSSWNYNKDTISRISQLDPNLVESDVLEDLVPGCDAGGPGHVVTNGVRVCHVGHHLGHHLLCFTLDALNPTPLVN